MQTHSSWPRQAPENSSGGRQKNVVNPRKALENACSLTCLKLHFVLTLKLNLFVCSLLMCLSSEAQCYLLHLQVTSTWCRDLFWSLLIHNAHYIFTCLWTNNTVFWTRAEPTPLEQRDNFQETLQKFCFVSQKSFWDIYSRIKVFTMPRSAFPVARLPKDRITANGRDLAKQMELACFDRCELESLSVCLVHS